MKLKIFSAASRKPFKLSDAKTFVHDYSFPIIVTVIFLLILAIASMIRISQKSSLVELLTEVSGSGQNDGILLSNDKTEELKKNDEIALAASGTPVGTPTSFAINPNTQSSSSAASTSTSSQTPAKAAFSASIGSFKQEAMTLECTSPKPKAQTCAKRYVFSASIRTKNGPGTVDYGWRSNSQSAIQDGSISAATGENEVSMQKVIILECNSATAVSLQFVLLSPSITQSAVLNINHNCNEI